MKGGADIATKAKAKASGGHSWEVLAFSPTKEVLRCKKCGGMAKRVPGKITIHHLIEGKKECLEES